MAFATGISATKASDIKKELQSQFDELDITTPEDRKVFDHALFVATDYAKDGYWHVAISGHGNTGEDDEFSTAVTISITEAEAPESE